MKRIFAITLAAVMVISLAACAGKAEAPAEETTAAAAEAVTEAPTEAITEEAAEAAAETEAVTEASEDEEPVGMPNPMVETDEQGVLDATGFKFNLPEGATDVQYFVIAGDLAEVRFKENGTDFTARMQAAEKFTDISGMYYTWTEEDNCKISYCSGKSMVYEGDEGDIHAALWYDAAPGVMYSLVAEAPDLDGFDIEAMAIRMFEPLQGDADALPLEDGETAVIVEPDYVTSYEDGTENILCQLFSPVVLDKEFVENLKEGDIIPLSDYPGLIDFEVEQFKDFGDGKYEINDYLIAEYDEELGGYIMRGLDDDITRYISGYRSVICDADTKISDGMGAIFWGEEGRAAKSITEAVETYGAFDAIITSKGGHAEEVIILYHP